MPDNPFLTLADPAEGNPFAALADEPPVPVTTSQPAIIRSLRRGVGRAQQMLPVAEIVGRELLPGTSASEALAELQLIDAERDDPNPRPFSVEARAQREAAMVREALTRGAANDLPEPVLGQYLADVELRAKETAENRRQEARRYLENVVAAETRATTPARERIASLQGEIEAIPQAESLVAFEQAPNTLRGKFGAVLESPSVIPNLAAESLPAALPGMVVGTVAGATAGPAGTAVGAFLGSMAPEFTAKLIDEMAGAGVDLKNPEQIAQFFADPAKLDPAVSRAIKKSAVIGAIDALSGGLAGRLITSQLGKGAGRMAVAISGEAIGQSALEGTGEALGELAGGEKLSSGDILAEILGGLPSNIQETATNVAAALRTKRQADGEAATKAVAAVEAAPAISTLAEMERSQQELATTARETEQRKAGAVRQEQAARGQLSDLVRVADLRIQAAQAREQSVEAIAAEVAEVLTPSSQPGTLPGEATPDTTEGTREAAPSSIGELSPAPPAQPAAVSALPESGSEAVVPLEEIVRAEENRTNSETPSGQQGLVTGEEERVRLRDFAPGVEVPVVQAIPVAPEVQPVANPFAALAEPAPIPSPTQPKPTLAAFAAARETFISRAAEAEGQTVGGLSFAQLDELARGVARESALSEDMFVRYAVARPEASTSNPFAALADAPPAAPTPAAIAGPPQATPATRGVISNSAVGKWADSILRQGRLLTGPDPELIFAYAVKGAQVIEEGVRDFAAWSARMGQQFASLSADQLRTIYAQSQDILGRLQRGETVELPPETPAATQTPATPNPFTALADQPAGPRVPVDDDQAIEDEVARQNDLPPPTPDTENLEAAEAEGLQATQSTPPAERDPVVTQVLDQEFTVDGRRQWTAGEFQRSRNLARRLFDESGLPVTWDAERGIFVLDPTEDAEAAGWKFVEALKAELGRHRSPSDPLTAVLVNSVRSQDGGLWTNPAFSTPLRNELFAVAQSEASHYGLMLGALASAKRTLSWVATHVDVVLHKAYSAAFSGPTVQSVLTDVANEIQKETGVDPRKRTKTRDEQAIVDRAKKRALDRARRNITPRQRQSLDQTVKRGKSLWQRITDAVNAGVFDNTTILQQLAREQGWTVPTELQIRQLREMAAREQELRTITDAEKEALGGNEQAVAIAEREKAAATREERLRLRREMQTMWSRFARPITFRTAEGRRNLGSAGAEYLSASMLLKLGFWAKQPIDVLSQIFWHTPGRAIAAAADQARLDRAAGRPLRFFADAGRALEDATTNAIASIPQGLREAGRGFVGRGQLRNVEGITGTIALFDRMRQQAAEADAAGQPLKAFALRVTSYLDVSFRLARSLDNFQGTLAEGQEQRERLISELRENGRTPERARVEADEILGDRSAEIALATARAKQLLDDAGIDATPGQLRAAAYELFKARQYERMRAAGLDADQIAREIEVLRQTIGWNQPEEHGIGGAIGKIVTGVGRSLERIGIPLPIGRFGNAIAIGTNRALTWTPVGLFPSAFGHIDPRTGISENYWFRTPKDRVQRKLEAATGMALGTMLVGMAASGLIRVWNKGPDDPEDRELWEKDGHRAGTVEFHLPGTNRFVALSTSTGPLSFVRGALGGIGAMQDTIDASLNRQTRLADEARRRGLTVGPVEGLDASDLFAAGLYGAYTAIAGGRTAGGAVRSIIPTDRPGGALGYLKSLAASQGSPFIPGLPAIQEWQRASGVRLDYRTADFSDLLLPREGSDSSRRNFLNDRLTPSFEQNFIQTLTGGNYPLPLANQQADQFKPYRILRKIDWRPAPIGRDRGFVVGRELRPLTDEEWATVMRLRGTYLKAALNQMNEQEQPALLQRRAQAAGRAATAYALERAIGPQAMSLEQVDEINERVDSLVQP